MVIPNIRERLICPKCEIKLRELEMPKDNHKCDSCGTIWQLVIDDGLMLKIVYSNKDYQGPHDKELMGFEDLLTL